MRNLAAGHQGAYLNKVIAAYASFNGSVQRLEQIPKLCPHDKLIAKHANR